MNDDLGRSLDKTFTAPAESADAGRLPAPSSGGFVPLRLALRPAGLTVLLTQPDMILGRQTRADIRLPLPDVSRRHCRFIFEDAIWHLVDLDSLNGVFVNGERVLRAALQAGDTVRIGGFEFEVQYGNRASANRDDSEQVFPLPRQESRQAS
jgi:pSer/pThr/pTyr-binding forkhead associated (FHA) protein